jgi:septal ring factor EnvC (AmiA/AmiB activator)
MRPAPRNSLLALLPLLAVLLAPIPIAPAAGLAQSTPKPTQAEIRAAELTRAAELAAQKAAAARAAKANDEEQRLLQARIAAAETLRVAESATADAAARMDALAARRRDAETRLAQRAAAMQPLLPLIERLSLYPAETLLAVPAAAENRLRAVLVLQGLSRQLEIEAKALRQDRADAVAASTAIAAETPKLAANLATQAARAAELDRLIADAKARRQQAETAADTAAQRAAAEAARADSLRAALAALETQRKAEEERAHEDALRADKRKHASEAETARRREAALAHPAASLGTGAQAKGRLTIPVVGKLAHAFGDPTEAGSANGAIYSPPPNARVVAPCSGKIAFADKFRTYGQLMIFDCGGGYHVVLSGLERLDAKAGQAVQAGEPVGTMPNWEAGGAGRRPTLYLELRHNGQPVDPAPWLRGTG